MSSVVLISSEYGEYGYYLSKTLGCRLNYPINIVTNPVLQAPIHGKASILGICKKYCRLYVNKVVTEICRSSNQYVELKLASF